MATNITPKRKALHKAAKEFEVNIDLTKTGDFATQEGEFFSYGFSAGYEAMEEKYELAVKAHRELCEAVEHADRQEHAWRKHKVTDADDEQVSDMLFCNMVEAAEALTFLAERQLKELNDGT